MTTETKKRTKRRGNGEGSIYQRADGRWCATLTLGYNAVGKRNRRVVYGDTKKEVQDKLTRLQSKKLDGSLCDSGKLTVADFLARWLESAARPTLRATTFANYTRAVNKHITPLIGGIPLGKLTPASVQGLYAQIESGNTKSLAHKVLHRAFKQATKWGMVVRNVCDAVDPPRIQRSEIKPLDTEQAMKLLAAAKGNRFEALFVVAVGTGLRLGELFGLQWPDLDVVGSSLTVRRTLTDLGGHLSLSEPKTAKSRRRCRAASDRRHGTPRAP